MAAFTSFTIIANYYPPLIGALALLCIFVKDYTMTKYLSDFFDTSIEFLETSKGMFFIGAFLALCFITYASSKSGVLLAPGVYYFGAAVPSGFLFRAAYTEKARKLKIVKGLFFIAFTGWVILYTLSFL